MAGATGGRILVVEESVLIAMGLEAALAERGHEVVTAGSLMAAYMVLGEQPFAGAMINPDLPDGRGERLAREMIEAGAATALVIGGHEPGLPSDLASAMRFAKPVDPAEVVRWFEQALAPRTAEDQ